MIKLSTFCTKITDERGSSILSVLQELEQVGKCLVVVGITKLKFKLFSDMHANAGAVSIAI